MRAKANELIAKFIDICPCHTWERFLSGRFISACHSFCLCFARSSPPHNVHPLHLFLILRYTRHCHNSNERAFTVSIEDDGMKMNSHRWWLDMIHILIANRLQLINGKCFWGLIIWREWQGAQNIYSTCLFKLCAVCDTYIFFTRCNNKMKWNVTLMLWMCTVALDIFSTISFGFVISSMIIIILTIYMPDGRALFLPDNEMSTYLRGPKSTLFNPYQNFDRPAIRCRYFTRNSLSHSYDKFDCFYAIFYCFKPCLPFSKNAFLSTIDNKFKCIKMVWIQIKWCQRDGDYRTIILYKTHIHLW